MAVSFIGGGYTFICYNLPNVDPVNNC